MRRFFLLALASAACATYSQTPATTTATAPAAPRRVPIPAAKAAVRMPVTGKLRLHALYANSSASSIVFYIDDKQVGKATSTPYACDWDTASVSDGDHIASWKAVDASDKEIAAGSITLATTGNGVKPATPPASPQRPKVWGKQMLISKYRVSLRMPNDWTVKDQTQSLPKDWVQGYWLVVSTDPLSKAKNVLNIRHKLETEPQTAESFAKTATYVSSWERAEIGGRPAFVTTAGSAASKRVVHRAIMLDGQHVWMMNLIDTSGADESVSKGIMLDIAGSITLAGPPAGR